MNYIVVSFRSRAETLGFYKALRSNGIVAEIINTPKEANIGCGLSVKLGNNNLNIAKNILKNINANTFAGVFGVKVVGNKKFIFKV